MVGAAEDDGAKEAVLDACGAGAAFASPKIAFLMRSKMLIHSSCYELVRALDPLVSCSTHMYPAVAKS